jgi:8-oxo-dGTP pyrophosphatase MutT (NUDIX family)
VSQPVADRPPGAVLRMPGYVADVVQGRLAPVAPRDAASVLLLRPAPGGIEVFLLRRARSMAFAPGASAFPGGSVDPRDSEEEVAWAGPGPAAWGRQLAAPPALARALVCAAVRETFEETGVLLAGPTDATLVADTSEAGWEADRRAVADHSLSLAALLHRRGLVLRSDLLRPWARWITPEAEPRRFDTRFFVAALPPGQLTRHVGGEADQSAWWQPEAALQAARERRLALFPPTAVCLADLAACGEVAAALQATPDLSPVAPQVVAADGEFWLVLPANVDYPL